MPLSRIQSSALSDSAVTSNKIASTLDLTGKTVTLPSGTGGKVVGYKYVQDNAKKYLTSSGVLISTTYTPLNASNKIIVRFCLMVGLSNVNGRTGVRRNGSFIGTQAVSTYAGTVGGTNTAEDSQGANQDYSITPTFVEVLDSPNTTSQITYDYYWELGAGSGFYNLNRQNIDNGGSAVSSITIIEVAP
jgi:hypothetical protein